MDTDLIKLLTEDLKSHREHIQSLYRNAGLAAGVVLAIAVWAILFIAGERINSELVDHVVQTTTQDTVTKLAEAETGRLLQEATKEFELVIDSKIQKDAEKAVRERLRDIDDDSIRSIITNGLLPSDGVLIVDADSCPNGWFPWTTGNTLLSAMFDFYLEHESSTGRVQTVLLRRDPTSLDSLVDYVYEPSRHRVNMIELKKSIAAAIRLCRKATQ